MNNVARDLFSLRNKHAVVTGGGSGIGFAIAEGLVAAGATVTIIGRRQARLVEATDKLSADNDNATVHYYACDLCELDAIAAHAQKLNRTNGEVDILVNAAGWRTRESAADITPQTWRATLDTNLSAPFFLARAFAPAMCARGWGRVLNIASLQSRLAFAGGIAYGASKGGVAQLTRAMAAEWSAQGVNANAIAPGFFPTEMTAPLFEDKAVADALAARTAIGRNGKLDELKGAAIFFCAPASDYITGQILYIDGGFTAK